MVWKYLLSGTVFPETAICPQLFARTLYIKPELYGLRAAIKQRRKVRFDYQREDGAKSSRTVRPLGLFYWGKVWTLVAWCELRESFRHFRLERMSEIASLNDGYESIPGRTLQDFLEQCE